VKEAVLGDLCNDLIAKGINGLTPLGSTGEFPYLNQGQRDRIVEVTVEAAGNRVPVIPGVSAAAVAGAITQAKTYQLMGATGILLTLDVYFPLSELQIEAYFRGVADAIELPIIIYTNPTFQKFSLSIDLIERLSKHPNIVALKDASTNTGRLLSVLNRCGDRLDVFAASSHIPLSVMMIGGKGWLAGPACIIPSQSVELYRLCVAGEWSKAKDLQCRLWEVNEIFERYSLAACIKAALEEQGYPVGDPVFPLAPLGGDERSRIREVLNDVATLGPKEPSFRARGRLLSASGE
jgi:4-hydroxy-tetrahydrodipicolinate synthase